MSVCKQCGAPLDRDAIAIHRRMLDREAPEADCLCKACLAAFFGITEQAIEDKIRHFKEMGCTLFDREPRS